MSRCARPLATDLPHFSGAAGDGSPRDGVAWCGCWRRAQTPVQTRAGTLKVPSSHEDHTGRLLSNRVRGEATGQSPRSAGVLVGGPGPRPPSGCGEAA